MRCTSLQCGLPATIFCSHHRGCGKRSMWNKILELLPRRQCMSILTFERTISKLKQTYATYRLESIVVFALLVLAVAVRLPYLYQIPLITDEFSEVSNALRLATGDRFFFVGPAS